MSNNQRVGQLTARWSDDGASRGAAYIELRDLAIELEQENEKLKADVAMLREALKVAYEYCPDDSDFDYVGTALSATASSDAWLKEQKAKARDFTFECAARMVEGRLRDAEDGGRLNHEIRKIAAVIRDKGWQLRFITDCESLEKSAADLRSPDSDTDQATRFQ